MCGSDFRRYVSSNLPPDPPGSSVTPAIGPLQLLLFHQPPVLLLDGVDRPPRLLVHPVVPGVELAPELPPPLQLVQEPPPPVVGRPVVLLPQPVHDGQLARQLTRQTRVDLKQDPRELRRGRLGVRPHGLILNLKKT